MATPRPIRRLIVCVDGTWYGPDGSASFGNNSNVWRISIVVKKGIVQDANGTSVEQITRYYHGIGVGDATVDKWNKGITGRGCSNQIKQITKVCCELLDLPDDELWLYGFSRGAYVVRAVAGLFHHMRAFSSEALQDFNGAFEAALSLYEPRRRFDRKKAGQIYEHLANKTRDPPVIKFVGVFDTVKAMEDRSLHDISFVPSVQNLRHALAINENRNYMWPEVLDPELEPTIMDGRTFVQAWFLGAHPDMGGATRHDGLSLYPLQWMLLESKDFGLVLEHDPPKALQGLIENPLTLVFPEDPNSVPEAQSQPMTISYKNGIRVNMHDLRAVHNQGAQAMNSSSDRDTSHALRMNQVNMTLNKPRKPFKSGRLIGHSESGPYGTIIHPSVYLIIDVYPHVMGRSSLKTYERALEDFRASSLTEEQEYPWQLDWGLAQNNVKAFRILVCGKTGVGKSTLINRVFGVRLTEESEDLNQGVHDIDIPFQSPMHPGLIIHDSRGYQAGSFEELRLIEKFVKKRSSKAEPSERLHAIWFCLQSDTRRIEKGDTEIFEIVAKHAADVPLFVVGTKKDDFLDNYTYKALKKKRGQDPANTEMAEAEAADAFAEQQAQIRARLQLDDAHSVIDFVYVSSKDDLQSVKNLLSRTLETIDNENVRLFCVAAQVVDVDQKIDSAVAESIRLGRHAVNTAMTPLPLSAAISTPTVSRLLCDHILRCFGFPKVTSSRIDDIMRKLVWGNLSQFMVTTTLYFFGVTGVAAGIAIGTFGFGAVFGFVSCLLAAPPTARMIVKCACDLILILERSFSYGGKYVSEKEIEDAAEYYVSSSSGLADSKRNTRQKRVHSEVDKLIPLISKTMGNNLGTIRVGMRDIIEQHRFGKRVESTTLSSEQEVNLLDLVDDEERALADVDKVWRQSTPSASPMNSPRLSPSVATRSSYIDSTASPMNSPRLSPSVTTQSSYIDSTASPSAMATSIQTATTRSSTGDSVKSGHSGRSKWKLFERKRTTS